MHKKIKKWLIYSGLLILVGLAGGVGYKIMEQGTKEESVQIETYRTDSVSEGFKTIAENQYLELLFEEATAQIALKDKVTKKMWYSNPQNLEEDALVSKSNKGKLKAQLTLVANSPKGDLIEMNSYDYSVAYGQFKYTPIENGVEVAYTLGEQEGIYCLPQIISEERMMTKILDLMEDGPDKKAIINGYKKLDLQTISDDKEKQELLDKYPQLESVVLYTLRDKQPDFRLEQMSKAILSVGYTFEDLAADEEENGLPGKEQSAKFIVPIRYILDEKDLVVTVPMEEVKGTRGYPITNIRVLEYFGAADMKTTGYMMVPDGSGALIQFNNGKTNMPSYVGKVYGEDLSIEKVEQIGNAEQIYFPVYGMKFEDGAFIAIAQKGEAVASVQADIAGKVNAYNNVYYDFNVTPNQKMRMPAKSGDTVISVYQNRRIEEDLQIRYAFMEEENPTYVHMANTYRNYLTTQGILKPQEIKQTPFVVEYIGAIDRKQHMVGIPYIGLEPLTTYEQAKYISNQLVEDGVRGLAIRYTGMANEGIYHTLPIKIKPTSVLGGRRDFKALQSFSQVHQITIYPEFDTQYVHENQLLDGFSTYLDSARLITKRMSKKVPYNSATYVVDEYKNKSAVATPAFALETAHKLADSLVKNKLTGLSVSNLGKELSSDFNAKKTVDRQQSLKVSQAQLEAFTKRDLDVMVSGGNVYSLPYASIVTDVPNESNGYNLLDSSIPFMQIVLHGTMPYTSSAINLAKDYKHMVLKNVEVGAGLYYTWTYADNAVTKDTYYSKYYATHYRGWIDEAVALYKRVEEDLGDTYNQKIIDHKEVAKGVVVVTYEKGKKVIVNYTEHTVNIEGVEVKAEDYTVVQGGVK